MDNAKMIEVRQWLVKARHDLDSARVLVDRGLMDTGVYHCQQAVEKVLKAYLTWQDTPLMKVHDLTALVKQCLELDGAFEELMDMADVLTPYAIAFRYPGEVLEPDALDAEEALALADSALEFISGKIPDAGRESEG